MSHLPRCAIPNRYRVPIGTVSTGTGSLLRQCQQVPGTHWHRVNRYRVPVGYQSERFSVRWALRSWAASARARSSAPWHSSVGTGAGRSRIVDVHEREQSVGAGCPRTGDAVFDLDVNTNLHRSAKGSVDLPCQHDHVTFANWRAKDQFVNGGRDRDPATMTLRCDRRADIDPTHHRAAKGCPKCIGVLWQDDFRHVRQRFCDRSRSRDHRCSLHELCF